MKREPSVLVEHKNLKVKGIQKSPVKYNVNASKNIRLHLQRPGPSVGISIEDVLGVLLVALKGTPKQTTSILMVIIDLSKEQLMKLTNSVLNVNGIG